MEKINILYILIWNDTIYAQAMCSNLIATLESSGFVIVYVSKHHFCIYCCCPGETRTKCSLIKLHAHVALESHLFLVSSQCHIASLTLRCKCPEIQSITGR
jgi:hypothetical protein